MRIPVFCKNLTIFLNKLNIFFVKFLCLLRGARESINSVVTTFRLRINHLKCVCLFFASKKVFIFQI